MNGFHFPTASPMRSGAQLVTWFRSSSKSGSVSAVYSFIFLRSKYDVLVSEVKSLRKSSRKKKMALSHPYARTTVMDRLKATLKSAPLSKIRYINGQRGIGNGLKRLVSHIVSSTMISS